MATPAEFEGYFDEVDGITGYAPKSHAWGLLAAGPMS